MIHRFLVFGSWFSAGSARFIVLSSWLLAFGFWLLVAQPAEAHTGPPYIVVENRDVGPYTVTVWTDPDTGTGTFIVEALHSGAATAENTTVAVAVRPADGHSAETSATAQRESYDPKIFTAHVPFDVEGPWNVAVTLDGPAGRSATTFDVQVTSPYPSWLLTLLCLLPFIGVGVLWLYVVHRQHTAARVNNPA